MQRLYSQLVHTHLQKDRQMIFLVGPRQVGKTTLSKQAKPFWGEENYHYLNWDNSKHREWIISGESKLAERLGLAPIAGKKKTLIVFDELHKFKKWKRFLKGFFDTYEDWIKVIVTGSARLDVYQKEGDSLMGRYFLYRIHPLSIREVLKPDRQEGEILPPLSVPDEVFLRLLNYGGFPESYLKHDNRFLRRWHQLRNKQLFREDIRDLTKLQEIDHIELLAKLLTHQAGQLVNFSNLSKAVKASVPSMIRWVNCLKSFYFGFTIQPWHQNVKRSLIKEPKFYLWDWSAIADLGARAENFVASHLYKAIQFWEDQGLGKYQLAFVRDKEQNEVDFLVVKNDVPWILVEVKHSHRTKMTEALYAFQKDLAVKHAFQVVFDLESVDEDFFAYKKPVIVPVQSFLSQLV